MTIQRAPLRFAAINFDHMHMGDLLRMVREHPRAEIVGLSDLDVERVKPIAERLNITADCIFTDFHQCLTVTRPDIVVLCPNTGQHGDYVQWVAPYDVHILIEKPMAATLADAHRMMAAMAKTGKTLVINWPLAWYPAHITAHRLMQEGLIGELIEVHYYDGNRGPLRHSTDKIEIGVDEAARLKSDSWWYRRENGGGSLMDYLGYGVTLGSWFHGSRQPIEVTTIVDDPPGLEVDEHSITVAKYASGLSKYETRWGTFSDPWTNQPQPKCGFVLVGTAGTISTYDFEQTIRIQTLDNPEQREVLVDIPKPPFENPIQYLIHCLETQEPVTGPLSPEVSLIGQRIVETAIQSAALKRTLPLI